MQRRSVLFGLAAAIAAPAIVRAQSIMPVRVVRWVRDESVRGVKTWVAYPWVVTIDYDVMHPAAIQYSMLEDSMHHWNQPGITVQSLHIPESYDPMEDAPLDGGFVPKLARQEPFPIDPHHPLRRSGFTLKEIKAFDIDDLKTLGEINADSFKYVTFEELNTGQKPVMPRIKVY